MNDKNLINTATDLYMYLEKKEKEYGKKSGDTTKSAKDYLYRRINNNFNQNIQNELEGEWNVI